MGPGITEIDTTEQWAEKPAPSRQEYPWNIRWKLVLFFTSTHIGAVYGLLLLLTFQPKFWTYVFTFFLVQASGVGVTAGAHRLWSHRSYKAKTPLRLLLAAMCSSAFQHTIYRWARDHRVHHKYVDTDADPHNARRGFFFSHVGWLLVTKLEEVEEKYNAIDVSDLENDWVVAFQKKYFGILVTLFCFVLPTFVPCMWGEDPITAFFVCALFRYTYVLHMIFCINSAAHMWGTRPYDEHRLPAENIYVSTSTWGEGWHNYHHAFPWDYKASEFTGYRSNVSQMFIDFFAWVGWAYDLKTANPELVVRTAARRGDGSHPSVRNIRPGQ